MVAALVMVALTLQSGLAMRSARLRRVRRAPELRPKHLRRARVALVLLALGAIGGPLSMWFLRGRVPFATAHAWIGSLAMLGFVATALLGRRLESREFELRDRHALLALLSVLAAAAAFGTGFVLLP